MFSYPRRLVCIPAAVTLGVALVVALVTLALEPSAYEATARVRIHPRTPGLAQGSSGLLTDFFANPLLTASEVLKASVVMDEAVHKLARRGYKLSVLQLRDGLTVRNVRDTDILLLTYKSNDAKLSYASLVSIIDAFLEESIKESAVFPAKSRKILEEQLRQARRRYADARKRKSEFEEKHGAGNVDAEITNLIARSSAIDSSMEDLKMDLSDKRAKLDSLEAQLRMTASEAKIAQLIASDPESQTLRQRLAEQELRLLDLKSRYRDGFAKLEKVKARVQSIKDQLYERVRLIAGDQGVTILENGLVVGAAEHHDLISDLVDADAQVRSIEEKLMRENSRAGKVRSDLDRLPPLQVAAAQLSQEVDASSKAVADLEQKLGEARRIETMSTGATNVRVIDWPQVPTQRTSVDRNRILAACLGIGLAAGALTFFALQELDPTVQRVGEVLRLLPFQIVGWSEDWPRVMSFDQMQSSMARIPASWRQPFSTLPSEIIVTSSNRDDGKSVVAAGLAMRCANQGLRVLLVDADFANPSLHVLFSVPSAPGLKELFTARDPDFGLKIGRKVQDNLRLISSGAVSPAYDRLQPGEVLHLIQKWKPEVDVIIVDAPSADAFSLLRSDSHLLLVARLRHSKRVSLSLLAAAVRRQKVASVGLMLCGARESAIASALSKEASSSEFAEATEGAEASIW